MAIVPVRINGRDYNLACDDGQEEQLIALAEEVDDRVRQISRQAPHAGEVMLFLLSSIMLSDELADTRRQVRQLNGKLIRMEERFNAGGLTPPPDVDAAPLPDFSAELAEERQKMVHQEEAIAETLKEVAERIEKIAQQLEIE